jgi:hypothetical protein
MEPHFKRTELAPLAELTGVVLPIDPTGITHNMGATMPPRPQVSRGASSSETLTRRQAYTDLGRNRQVQSFPQPKRRPPPRTLEPLQRARRDLYEAIPFVGVFGMQTHVDNVIRKVLEDEGKVRDRFRSTCIALPSFRLMYRSKSR